MKRIEFTIDSAPQESGEFVIRSGKVFAAGDYPDKSFALSADEMLHAATNHVPARLNIEHSETPFDLGDLGTVERLEVRDDSLFADVKIDRHIDAYMQKHNIPLKVSAEWDRDTKMLEGLALVKHPRVHDAALYAAFAASKPMQRLHDSSVDYGAECGGKSYFANAASFMTNEELKAIQHVHDHTMKNGADCNAYATRQAMYFSEREKDKDKAVEKAAEVARAGDSGGKGKPAMTKWETFTNGLKALFGQAGIEVEGAAPAEAEKEKKPEASAADAAKFAEMQTQITKANELLVAMAADRETDKKAAQFSADATTIDTWVRAKKMTPAEGDEWKKIAKDTPAAFAAASPALEKRHPLPQLVGYGNLDGEAARGAAGGATGDAGDQLIKFAQEKVEKSGGKVNMAVAMIEASREHPDLAREHANSAPSYGGDGPGGHN